LVDMDGFWVYILNPFYAGVKNTEDAGPIPRGDRGKKIALM